MDQVRDHLGDYLDRSRLLLGKQATIDPDLYLLIAQCFEVYYHSSIVAYFMHVYQESIYLQHRIQ